MAKWQKIFMFVFMMIIVVYGFFCVNINVNRQIYTSLQGKSIMDKENGNWDLDNMINTLNSSQSIKKNKEDEYIPKFRVLFNVHPFDFRIDTNKYVFYINKDVLYRINPRYIFKKVKYKSLKIIEQGRGIFKKTIIKTINN